MKQPNNFRIKTNKTTVIALAVIVVFGLILTGISFMYFSYLNTTFEKENRYYLNELSNQMSSSVAKEIKYNFNYLEILYMSAIDENIETFDKFFAIAEREKDLWNFIDVFVIGENGEIYTSEGDEVIGTGQKFISSTVDERVNSVYLASDSNDQRVLIFSKAIDDLLLNGRKIVGISTVYDLNIFEKNINIDAFDKMAKINIMTPNGTLVVSNVTDVTGVGDYNFFRMAEKSATQNEESIVQMKEDISENKFGDVILEIDGKREYVSYSPIGIEKMYFVVSVVVDVVNAQTKLFMTSTYMFLGFVIFIGMGLSIMLYYRYFKGKKEIERIAFVDSLTKTSTTQHFILSVEKHLRFKHNSRHAIVYTNLDKFRIVNELFGREVGNGVLVILNAIFKESLADDELIGRMSADHFILFLNYTNESELAKRFEEWGDKFSDSLRDNKFEISPPVINYGVYIVNVEEDPESNCQLMIDRAKFSLSGNQISLGTRTRYSIYNLEYNLELMREKEIEDLMEDALKNEDFKLYLQPKYSTDSEEMVGAEALVRWHGKYGMIYPNEFISLFERNGFILHLDHYIFEQTCKQISRWIEEDKKCVKISVNLSQLNFEKTNFLDDYIFMIQKYKVPTEYIEFEITESAIYKDTQRIINFINRIHELGITCSVDDFGSGYSSLNRLKEIQADTLKIDGIFFKINDDENKRAYSIVRSIVEMAKNLNMKTVAEGVESREQVDLLKKMGCDLIQGYYFAKPMTVKDFEERYNKK
ncbi:bifunctional diguanylate cyclase/phosphodiesterase [Anaerorhabdus sp.]|uniref:bifunctional diguanylate cyclase/phosphodiesterase n=3 Tax=Anaerorhabdus sp. TaxID=1872524 RepID=UPI002FC771C5